MFKRNWVKMDAAGDSQGGGGGDTLSGGDTLAGGNDTLAGDTLSGGQDTNQGGNDTIIGADTITGGDDTLPGIEADWPQDWREKAAGGDEKRLKQLARYASPQAAMEALFAAQDKIRSGQLKTALKSDATQDEVKAWRSENGIPDTPEAYEVKLANGFTLGEADKPVVDEFLKVAHKSNMHPDQANEAINWYMAQQQQSEDMMHEADANFARESVDVLRAEWGPEYRTNITLVESLVENAPRGVGSLLGGARLSDGTALLSNPATLRWLSQLAREVNPVAPLLAGTGLKDLDSVQSEIDQLKSMMGDSQSAYWKGTKAKDNQARYKTLIEYASKQK